MIYFIQYGKDGPVKIGMVGGKNIFSVSSRLATLQGNTPTKLRLIGFCQGERKEEILLHKAMRKFRVSGEWFELRRELIDTISELSDLSEQDFMLQEETISADKLVKQFQDEFDCDIYYKELNSLVTSGRKLPFYEVFGKKRYKYEECRDCMLSIVNSRTKKDII
jgi:hypothetical protein